VLFGGIANAAEPGLSRWRGFAIRAMLCSFYKHAIVARITNPRQRKEKRYALFRIPQHFAGEPFYLIP